MRDFYFIASVVAAIGSADRRICPVNAG